MKPRHDCLSVMKNLSQTGTPTSSQYSSLTLVVSLSGGILRIALQLHTLIRIAIGALLGVMTFGLHVDLTRSFFTGNDFIPPLLFADGWKAPTRDFIASAGREIFRAGAGAGLVTGSLESAY
ncbi:hypothetical protein KCP69_00795 [Salmonella enterica subsp. enterica]|nr:hypothetical protein KCP69_00795 [Salmonella enterica subsp. enterica]